MMSALNLFKLAKAPWFWQCHDVRSLRFVYQNSKDKEKETRRQEWSTNTSYKPLEELEREYHTYIPLSPSSTSKIVNTLYNKNF